MCLDFSSNLQNRCCLIQTILMRVKTLCSHQNYTCLKFGLNQKWNISLNFWVNIGMWPIVSVQLAMPDTTMMSEYMIYMVWKLIADVLSNNLCHIYVTISKIGCHRLTQQHWHACTNEILEIWKLHILWHNFIKCAQIFFKPSEQMLLYPDDSNEG